MYSPNNEEAVKFHKELVENCVLRSCLNCEYWLSSAGTCIPANARPPVDVIVFGCDNWARNLPF